MKKTTILIADDHKLIRELWTLVLNTHPGFTVVAEAGSGEEAIELGTRLKPQIVLMDIHLPGMDGIEATKQIRKFSPDSKILAISLHTRPMYARQIMKMGALGYVCKTSSHSEMFTAIKEVQMGRKYICQEIKNNLATELLNGNNASLKVNCLTPREVEIIDFIKLGKSSRQIAESLDIAVKTVEVHRYNILKKLNLKNSSAVVNFINMTRSELYLDSPFMHNQPGIS
jgi:DNA-binding NarL/FixJ family response regulator